MIREAFQDLNRLRQIAVIAARHGFADKLERTGLWRKLGRQEVVEETPEARRESVARRFKTMLNELGPTFIKLGQILSTRADLLPAEYIEELATLQDNVPPIPLETVKAQIRSSLGKDASELFKSIESTPLAAASIAQVHRAVTLSGEEVVIKIQRPGIGEQIRADLSVLRYIASLLEALVEETGIYTPVGIVDEFDRAIHEELDFLNEAANVRAFYENHKDRPNVKVPKVYDELSSRHVLTLEFIRGVKISQADLTKHDRTKLARTVLDLSFQQLFKDGLFHGDPHPGNLLVLEGDVIGLIDFGLVGRITPQMKDTLVMLILAISLKDSDSVARILYRVGEQGSRAHLISFRNDIESILNHYLTSTLGNLDSKNLLRDMLDLAVKYRIRIPKEYAILSRSSVAIEGILRHLHPEMKITEIALPYAKDLLVGQYDPTQLQGGLLRTLLRVQGLANDLPIMMSQILLDLEGGKFNVTVRAEQLEKLISTLRTLGVIFFLGLCACGFIIGAFLSFAQKEWVVAGVPVIGTIAIAMAASLLGVALGWYVFGGKFRKLSIAKMLKGNRKSRVS